MLAIQDITPPVIANETVPFLSKAIQNAAFTGVGPHIGKLGIPKAITPNVDSDFTGIPLH